MTILPDNTDPMLDGFNLSEPPAPESAAPATPELNFEFSDPTSTEQQPPAQVEPATPTPPAPAPAPQPVDLQQRILDTLDRMQQPQQAQSAPQQPPQWVDPASRPENVQRVNDLLERLSYDETARQEYNQLQAQWNTERTQHLVQEQLGQFQYQMTMQQQAPTVQSQAFQHVSQQYGQALSQDAFNAVVNEAFGGNAAQITQALNPQINPTAPQLAALLADAAYGRSLRTNPAAPQRPTPPATVRSDARNPAPGRATNDQWSDPNWVNSVIDQATADPFKFTRRNQ